MYGSIELVLLTAHFLTAGGCTQALEHVGIDRILQKPDGAVDHQERGTAGIRTAEAVRNAGIARDRTRGFIRRSREALVRDARIDGTT
jgi:hypothetical protein